MKHAGIRTLGIIGLIGAPWMFIDIIDNGLYERFVLSAVSGVRGFIFITGWTCSVLGLYRLQAMGTRRWQHAIMRIQLLFLMLANCWNILEIINPKSPWLQHLPLNLAWPLAGNFMLVTGIVILFARRMIGWKWYIPLLAGLWFPQTVLLTLTKNLTLPALLFTGIYATIVFTLLALCLILDNTTNNLLKPPKPKIT